MMYQRIDDKTVLKIGAEVNLSIPADPANRDYQDYLAWLAAGNTPEPADPQPAVDPWQQVREQRDQRLRGCDFTQLPDVPLTADQKAAWCTYRQALRDLPATYTDPAQVVWPEPPTP